MADVQYKKVRLEREMEHIYYCLNAIDKTQREHVDVNSTE